MELSEVAAFCERGNRVLLTLGPCSQCDRPKTDVLEILLNLEKPLFTDLAVDSRSARECLESVAKPT